MSWSEAFSRAFQALVALVVLYVVAIVLLALGGWAIWIEGSDVGKVFGLIFIIAGVGLFLLSGLAVFIKVMTDALAEHSSPAEPLTEEVSPSLQEPSMQEESRPDTRATVGLIIDLRTQVVSLHIERPNDEDLSRIRQELNEVWMQADRARNEEDLQNSIRRFEQLQEEFNQLQFDSKA